MIRTKNTFLYLFLVLTFVACGPQSRKLSRFTGKPVELKLPKDCVQVISVSIAQDSGATDNQIKNLTYINDKGDLITKEFSDWGFLEGSIKWVRHDGSSYARKRSAK